MKQKDFNSIDAIKKIKGMQLLYDSIQLKKEDRTKILDLNNKVIMDKILKTDDAFCISIDNE